MPRNRRFTSREAAHSALRVAQNIAFGVKREDIDMHAVERAARAAQIHNFVVNELSLGYDATVDDRGIRLSGGQRQRVGVARALYRDPSVLFFDEATSALDTGTEKAVNMAIRSFSKKKTMVLVAHKETSLRSCQRNFTLAKIKEKNRIATLQQISLLGRSVHFTETFYFYDDNH